MAFWWGSYPKLQINQKKAELPVTRFEGWFAKYHLTTEIQHFARGGGYRVPKKAVSCFKNSAFFDKNREIG